jgi:extracellular elastinolytic metalloproteinase
MIKKITLLSLLFIPIFNIFSKDFQEIAFDYIKKNNDQFNIETKEISKLKVVDKIVDDIELTHVWIQQSTNNIYLYNVIIGIHINKDGQVVHSSGKFIDKVDEKINSLDYRINMTNSVMISAKLMSENKWNGTVNKKNKIENGYFVFEPLAGLTNDPVKVRKFYFYDETKDKLRIGYEVTLENDDHSNSFSYHIDGVTGELINKIDNVIHCQFENQLSKSEIIKKALGDSILPPNTIRFRNNNSNNNNNDRLDNTNNTDAIISETSSYNVFPYFVEAPSFDSRQIISNPFDVVASPYGWHDTNGAAGAESNLTTGNNVDAYVDKIITPSINNNAPDAQYPRPDGGASLNFNFPLDLTQRTDTFGTTVTNNNYKAVVTQLFYTCNIVHDIMYKFGFIESTRNFQRNNYGRGGVANDFVKAEALDGSGTNNANFSSGTDGSSGRMQMYMFDAPLDRPLLIINAPQSIKDTVTETARAQFGPCNYNVTGTCAIVNDGSVNPTYACSPIINASQINGKIAIVDRNDCSFYSKVLKCQQSGAIGVIICNRVDSLIGAMSFTGVDAITIPSMLVTKSVGDILKNNINNGLNVTLYNNDPNECDNVTVVNINGALDNGVVIHEYGHGISNRLTGSGSNCLSNLEQGGEGWSDFFTLALTHKAGDTRNTPRGIGTFTNSEATTGSGIRTYQYTTDMAVNPWTYADVATMPETPITNSAGEITGYVPNSAQVHVLGELLAVTLWDLYWNLIDVYGYNSNLYLGTSGTSGNSKAISLVTKGLTLQGCSPGYINVRDGILKADSILFNKANTCLIWSTFARRGMGFSALQGSSNNCNDQTAAFNLPPSCNTTPTATASFTASDTTVCVGGSLTFTNTSTASSGSPDSVKWTIPGGVPGTSTSATTVTPTFSTAGTYVVSLIAYKSGNASVAATKSIRVKPLPTLSVTSPAICSGNTAQPIASGNSTSYSWTGGLAAVANPTTGVLTTTTTYTVTGTRELCTATAVSTVTVNAAPTVSVNSPTICSGTTADLTVTGTATTFAWTGGLASTATPTTPVLTTTTTYTVTGTLGTCSKTAVATVTVTALPNVTVNSPSICSGATATLTATNATSYTWSPNIGGTASVTTPALTTTTTYTVTGTANGCTKSAVATGNGHSTTGSNGEFTKYLFGHHSNLNSRWRNNI